MNLFSKLLPPVSRSQHKYAPLDERSIDREERPNSNKSEKPSGHQLGGNKKKAKGKPPTIPSELKGIQKSTQPAPTKEKPDGAARVHKTAMPASGAQTLPSKITLLLKVFGLSQAEAVEVSEGSQWSYFREMLEGTQPILVNLDGQLQMDGDSAWTVMSSIREDKLRFRFLASLDATSLVCLIQRTEAGRFHDMVSSWNGPATNDRLAARMAFDEAYTRAFRERLKNAGAATVSHPTTTLEELGLLLKAAPIWIVGDLFKLFDTEERLHKSFQANKAFDEGWKTAQENVKNAQENWLKDAEKKWLPPHVSTFFKEMNLSGEQGRALIARDPSLLLVAIDRAQDHTGESIALGDKLGLFRALINTAPALAWRYLRSTDARSYLMSYFSGEVARLLEQIADLSADGVRAEVEALVHSVVDVVKGAGNIRSEPVRLIAAWMNVLPASARGLLKQELCAAFKPDRIDGWLQSSEPLNAIWQATTSPDAANASVVG
ncbi:hypothetical protein [uncultured Hydrogenophaga sp.]|uniref:hypothetical protein n=1 Tax=uncultured Hydrogenophaga sp. TaxID=199683 RepID=UPI0025834E55|nr:hypothetical protein [uncultured Hydrogenophaga sp.]